MINAIYYTDLECYCLSISSNIFKLFLKSLLSKIEYEKNKALNYRNGNKSCVTCFGQPRKAQRIT